jgi:hypothetical protein
VREDVVVVIEEINHLEKLDVSESEIGDICIYVELRAKFRVNNLQHLEGKDCCDHALKIRDERRIGFEVPSRI